MDRLGRGLVASLARSLDRTQHVRLDRLGPLALDEPVEREAQGTRELTCDVRGDSLHDARLDKGCVALSDLGESIELSRAEPHKVPNTTKADTNG